MKLIQFREYKSNLISAATEGVSLSTHRYYFRSGFSFLSTNSPLEIHSGKSQSTHTLCDSVDSTQSTTTIGVLLFLFPHCRHLKFVLIEEREREGKNYHHRGWQDIPIKTFSPPAAFGTDGFIRDSSNRAQNSIASGGDSTFFGPNFHCWKVDTHNPR